MYALRQAITAVLLALACTVNAETITGLVVGIADGDTVTILDAEKKQHKIRLGGIDAPESAQAFGQSSKKNLSNMVFNRQVEADCVKRDKYRRLVCKILINGNDANLEQVRSGLAWHYKQYQGDQPFADRAVYAEAESAARILRVGLWTDANATPPWDYRRGGDLVAATAASDNTAKGAPQGSGGGPVKMSKSGICHAPGSTYYGRTQNYTPYPTLDACLKSGGRLPKR